jgi:hypothetical protein
MEMQRVESAEEEILNERNIIENLSEEEKFNYPLVAHNLTKIYVENVAKPKLALNKLNLLLKNNEIFSLLGYFNIEIDPMEQEKLLSFHC